MKLTIDELAGKEFAELLTYINRPENSFLFSLEKPSAQSKARIISIGSIEQRSSYALESESNRYEYKSLQLYKGIEIEVAESQMTSSELLDFMRRVYKFKESKEGSSQ